jgi:hypothetical protein
MMMNQSLDMTLFVITQWSLTDRDPSSPEEGIMMTVVLKRKIAKEILTTYVPTTLLMMITLATIFIKQFYFEAAMGTNLTTMLMMTTIFMTVMAELPSTAYVKHVDLWLIGCQLVPFLEVLLLITKETLREVKDDDEEASETVADAADVDATATAAVPATAVTLKIGEVVPASKLPKAMNGGQQESQTLGKPKTKLSVKIYQLLENAGM